MARQLPLSPDIPLPVQRALRTLTSWAGEDETRTAQISSQLSQLPAMRKSLSNLQSQMAGRGQTTTITIPGGFTVNGKTYHNLHHVSGQLLRYD